MDLEMWFWMCLVRPMLEGVRADLVGRYERARPHNPELFRRVLIVEDVERDILRRFGSPLTVGQAIDACLAGKTVRITRHYMDRLVRWDVTWTDNGGGWWVCVREGDSHRSESKAFPCSFGSASLKLDTFELVD